MKKLIKNIKDKVIGKVPLLKRRSSKWDDVRDAYIAQHNTCAACGSKEKLEVHHIVPFHIDPSKELDINNLITLCETSSRCHLDIGHLGNFRKANPDVKEHAADKLAKLSTK